MIESLSSRSREDIEKQFAGGGYSSVKNELAELTIGTLEGLQERYRRFEREPEIVDRILADGAERARSMASLVVEDVKMRIGLRGMAV
jgi:tryptophanyl-tRNA synthetase